MGPTWRCQSSPGSERSGVGGSAARESPCRCRRDITLRRRLSLSRAPPGQMDCSAPIRIPDAVQLVDRSSYRQASKEFAVVNFQPRAAFFRTLEPHMQVAAAMQHLSEENMLGADASILAFLRNADERRCRLIISQNEISGLVGLSDLALARSARPCSGS